MKLNLILLNFLRETDGNIDIATTSEYLYQIYLPIIVWLVLVLILIVILLKKYTLGHWTEKRPNPYESESMGLPRGTFRSILTLTLLFVSVILELVSVHTIGFEENVSEFLTAFQMMIAFYFGSKVLHHMTNSDKEKASFITKEDKERQERIEAISNETEIEQEVIISEVNEEIINNEVSAEEMFDDGSDEGMEEESFSEEIEFGGDDPDAKG